MHYVGLVSDAAFRPTLDIAQTSIFAGVLVLECLVFFGLSRETADMLTKRLTGRRVALAVVIAIVAARLIVAPYWVWQDESKLRIDAEKKIENLTNRNVIKRQLLAFYEEGEKLTNNGPTSRDPEGYKKFQAEYGEWSRRVSEWMDKNMERGASAKFKDYRPLFSKGYPGYAGADQQETWDRNYISWLCSNLDEMVKSDAWDKH